MWQRRSDGVVEVVLVHRPRYDDWSLPKGKVDDGETDEAAARREVEEEASVTCHLGVELASTSYVDRTGRPKVVRYWSMVVDAGEVGGANEIDRAEWVPLEEARQRLSYDRDLPVLDSFAEALPGL